MLTYYLFRLTTRKTTAMSSTAVSRTTSQDTRPRQRVHWIDVAKGFGIILVSFGHIRNGNGQSVWLPDLNEPINIIYLFHMPLFFFLGGFTFSSRRKFPDFIKIKAKTLLIPYYIFSLYFLAKPIAALFSPALVDGLRTNQDYASDIGRQFYNILINGSGLWFLWAYFIGELIVYPLSKYLTSQYQYILLGIVFIIASIFYNSYIHFTLPFCMVKGVEVAGYILIGIACKQLITHIPRTTASLYTVILLIALVVGAYFTAYVANHSLQLVCNMICAFIGVAMSALLSVAIASNAVLEYIGRHSLSFYVVNAFTLNIGKIAFFKVLGIDGLHASAAMQWVYGILLTAFCLFILWLEDLLIRILIPWSVGAKRLKPMQKEIDSI